MHLTELQAHSKPLCDWQRRVGGQLEEEEEEGEEGEEEEKMEEVEEVVEVGEALLSTG